MCFSLQTISLASTTGKYKTGHSTIGCALTGAKSRERITPFNLLATLRLKKASTQSSSHCAFATKMITFTLLSTRMLKSFLTVTFYPGYHLSCHVGLLHPKFKASYLLLLNFMMFLPVPFWEVTLNTSSNLTVSTESTLQLTFN